MMKVGIFFGGPSREREIAFAGGRTVYDNLNKSLFEPIPIFVDSLRNFILLDWQYLYKGTIRDFYPPVEFMPDSPNNFQVYIESITGLSEDDLNKLISKVGRRLKIEELPDLIDFAFLSLHGEFGEDGELQGILEGINIPYSGSGIQPSAIGMDKKRQKELMAEANWPTPNFTSINKETWINTTDKAALYNEAIEAVGKRLVVRPANQGSSIGVAILQQHNFVEFEKAVNDAFFIEKLDKTTWDGYNKFEKQSYIRQVTDIREGVGFPLSTGDNVIYHPEKLLDYINAEFESGTDNLTFEGFLTEKEVVVESFIEGKEFSCIVIRNEDGKPVALPPTEIVKGGEVFDYRSKYLPGLSRKITPIKLPNEKIEAIRSDCEKLYVFFSFNVYARIDGFIQEDGTIYLNDPNTTSGMLPSSFFFHQAAEIGLNPSQFITYIIRTSLIERIEHSASIIPNWGKLLAELDEQLANLKAHKIEKLKVAVLLGGFSSERHISVESGRNVYEKLASSGKYEPIPVFLTGSNDKIELYQIPINILLKDNADDIKDKIAHFNKHDVVEGIKEQCAAITDKYCYEGAIFEPMSITYAELAEKVDAVFIALHGRPGEDGAIQIELDKLGLPYNGSSPESSQVTINKYKTNQTLKQHGVLVAEQALFYKTDWDENPVELVQTITNQFEFPVIAKPVDDGCSSAVKKIETETELKAFLNLMFREDETFDPESASIIDLQAKEEFPRKNEVLIENFIDRMGAKYFLEITGGLLTRLDDKGNRIYEMFEPSEALAGGKVLSLEEKFLAGEGQNITPARFGVNANEYKIISTKVKAELKRVAEIMNVEGYCRIDAFVRVNNKLDVEIIIIEINSLPGMTPATCIFHQAAINGYKPFDFIDKILDYGFEKQHVESN